MHAGSKCSVQVQLQPGVISDTFVSQSTHAHTLYKLYIITLWSAYNLYVCLQNVGPHIFLPITSQRTKTFILCTVSIQL